MIGLAAGAKYLENVTEPARPRIDLLSVALSTVGFGGVVFGFSKAGEGAEGLTSPIVVVSIAIGTGSLILFVLRQLFMREPMMDLRVFRYPMFVVGLLLVLACMMIMLSSMIILPMYLQKGMALSAFAAGLMLLPGSALNGFLSPRMGKLFDKYGPKWLVLPGLVIVAIVTWLFSGLTPTSPIAFIIVLHMFLMVGIAMVWMPSQTNGLNQLPPDLYPHGTAVMNTLQQVSGAVGTAVAVSLLTRGMERYLAESAAPSGAAELANAMTLGSHSVFLFAMTVTLVGIAMALFIRRVAVSQGSPHPMH